MGALLLKAFWFVWPFVQWYVFALLAYTLLVFAVMECAVNHRVKMDGKLPVKGNGWVVKYLYRRNMDKVLSCETKSLPSSICQLYRGLWWGIPRSIFDALLFSIFVVVVTIGGFVLGFMPILKGEKAFHGYERYGEKDEKRWIAPWKFLVLLAGIYCLIRYSHKLWDITTGAASVAYGGGKILLGIFLLIVLVAIGRVAYYIIKGSTEKVRSSTLEYLKAKWDRLCLPVEVIE